MAQTLSSAAPHGDNSVNQGMFLDYLERHEDADAAIEDAKETVRSLNRVRKDLRKTIKADGINLDVFDRALGDGHKSGEERDAEDRQYRQYMAFQGKPVGYQQGFSFVQDVGDPSEDELRRIEAEGYQDGKSGHSRESNTYSPGTGSYESWDIGWQRGNDELDETELNDAPPVKRGRGRPRKNADGTAPADPVARRRGRDDALAGIGVQADAYPSGTPGHGDYMLGYVEGEQERDTPKRGRGRPRKESAPQLELVEGDADAQ